MRIREVTVLSGGAADTDALAVSQALQGATASTTGLAAAQQPNIVLDADGIAEAQDMTEDTPLVLEGAAAALSPPRKLTFTSASDLSGVNFEIVGTDENGAPQTVAAFVGPDTTTVSTTELWSSVTSITPDATDGNDVEVGWAATYQPMTLTGAAANLNPPRLVTLTSTGDFSAVDFTIVGLDMLGEMQSETIAGPSNNTVTSSGVYSSVTSITPNPADTVVATNISAGWPATTGSMLTQGITLEAAAEQIAVPREVTLTSASDLSSITFTIYGKDRRGNAFTEQIAGPQNGTVTSRSVFGSVQKIVPSATSASSVEAGLVEGGVSPWFLHNTPHATDSLPNGSLQVLSDSVAGEVEYTHQNAARIVGEGVIPDEDPSSITGDEGEVVPLEKRPWFRIRNADTTGDGVLKVAIARPSF